jgi:hypothetical protein
MAQLSGKGWRGALIVIALLYGVGKWGTHREATEAAAARASMSPAERATSDSLEAANELSRATKDRDETMMYTGIEALQASMRDPESFKLGKHYVGPQGGAGCIEFRAKNGFGGYNADEAVITPAITVTREQNEHVFVQMWNAVCVTHSQKPASTSRAPARHIKPLSSGPFVHDTSSMNNQFWQSKCKGTGYQTKAPIYFSSKASAEAAGYQYEQCQDTI